MTVTTIPDEVDEPAELVSVNVAVKVPGVKKRWDALTVVATGDPSPKFHEYIRPVPVPGNDPDESKLTVNGAFPIVGPPLAMAVGAPPAGGVVVVVEVPPVPPPVLTVMVTDAADETPRLSVTVNCAE